MARTRRTGTTDNSDPTTNLQLIGLGVFLAALGAFWGALYLGSKWAGLPTVTNPVDAAFEVGRGTRPWPAESTVILVLGAAAVLVVVALVIYRKLRRGSGIEGITSKPGRKLPIDAKARTMLDPRNLVGTDGSDAPRLAPTLDHKNPMSRGFLLGFTVIGNIAVWLSWEMVAMVMAGQRMGKTAAIAIRAVLDAPGAAVVTSNKPDLYTHTCLGRDKRALAVRESIAAYRAANRREPSHDEIAAMRARAAREINDGLIWLFDLQGVTGKKTTNFYWNPIRQVGSLASARKLASFFVGASKEKGARTDAYFDGGAQELLALHILAASRIDGDLLHVATWLGDETNPIPAQILRSPSLIGRPRIQAARRIDETQGLNPRQRDGLFDMARRFLNVLSDDEYAYVITPPQRTIAIAEADGSFTLDYEESTHDLPEFDPRTFVTSTDTLYAMSLEGPDSAAPLTTALIGQVFEAASIASGRTRSSRIAGKVIGWLPLPLRRLLIKSGGTFFSGGRLLVPLIAVLDEAANTVRLPELPDQYSHFGSRGIIPITILQNPEQGARVWGQEGLSSMTAGAVHYYGGNVKDKSYLSDLADLIGTHEVATSTRSRGQGSTTTSQQWHEKPIFTTSELAALPKTRAIVVFPENPPVLIRKVFWSETPHNAIVKESIALFGGVPDDDDDYDEDYASDEYDDGSDDEDNEFYSYSDDFTVTLHKDHSDDHADTRKVTR